MVSDVANIGSFSSNKEEDNNSNKTKTTRNGNTTSTETKSFSSKQHTTHHSRSSENKKSLSKKQKNKSSKKTNEERSSSSSSSSSSRSRSNERRICAFFLVIGLCLLFLLSYSVPTLNSYSSHGISTRLSEMIAMPIRMNGDDDDDDTASGSSNTNTTTMAMMATTTTTTTTSTTTTTKKKKPTTKFYAVHIGPSKTGTSTIQADTAHHNLDILEQDHAIYVGKTWALFRLDPNLGKKIRTLNGTSVTAREESKAYYNAKICMNQKLKDYYNYHRANSTGIPMDVAIDRLENDETTRAALRRTFITDCWRGKYRYMLEYSHIDSNEAYSDNFRRTDPTQVGNQLKIYDILGYDRVIVIGAYRRYAEWLTSTYNQLMKNEKSSCLKTDDTTQSPIMTKQCPNIWSDYIWPYINENKKKYTVGRFNHLDTTLPNARKSGPSKIEVKVLNYFQLPKNNTVHYNTITTELYCDALGMDLTPTMCNFSRERGRQQEQRPQQQQQQQQPQNNNHHNNNNNNNNSEELVTNKGSPENVAYQHIVETARRLALIIPTNEQLEANEKVRSDCKKQDVHVWCESLNRCIHPRKCKENSKAPIGELGTITVHGTNTSNITTWQTLATHHTKTLGLNWRQNLPLLCPPKHELEALLNKSLAFEELVLPKFYATPLGKEEHIRLFWDSWLEQKKLFCWVNTDRLFENVTTWDEILNERMVFYKW